MSFPKTNRPRLKFFGGFFVAIAVVCFCMYLLRPYPKEIVNIINKPGMIQQEKVYVTSLGWMMIELLSVPIILGFGAWRLAVMDQDRRDQINERQQRQEQIQLQWNRISNLMKDFHELLLEATNKHHLNLLLVKSISSHTVREIHNIRCLEDFRDEEDLMTFADSSRKRVFQTLKEANLIGFTESLIVENITNDGVFSGETWSDICFDSVDLSKGVFGDSSGSVKMKFISATFNEATLNYSILQNIIFDYRNYVGVTFAETILIGAKIRFCRFSNLNFLQPVFEEIEVLECDFENSSFINIQNMHESIFKGSKFLGVTFEGFEPSLSSRFEECTFKNVVFRKSNLTEFQILDQLEWAEIEFDEETLETISEKYQILYRLTKQSQDLDNIERKLEFEELEAGELENFLSEYSEKFASWIEPYRDEFPDDVEVSILSNSKFIKINFSRLDLSSFDFSGSTFTDCRFIESNLINTKFVGCKVLNCDFADSVIRDCDFSYSEIQDISRAKFINPNFSKSKFSGDISYCLFENSDFSGAEIKHISIFETGFDKPNLRDAKINFYLWPDKFIINWYLVNSKDVSAIQDYENSLVDADLIEIESFLEPIPKSDEDFRQLLLKTNDLSGLKLEHAQIEHQDLSGKIFTNSSFVGSSFKNVDFSGSDFSNVNLSDTTFFDCNFSKADLSAALFMDLQKFHGLSSVDHAIF